MPARSIDAINITNFVNTGQNGQIARYTFSLEIIYTDMNGVRQTHGPVTRTFPNELTTMPLAVRRRFAEDMIKAVVMVGLGIATWEDYQ